MSPAALQQSLQRYQGTARYYLPSLGVDELSEDDKLDRASCTAESSGSCRSRS